MPRTKPSNEKIAAMLLEIAELLEAQGENVYRIRSYRTAAQSVRDTSVDVAAAATAKGGSGIEGVKGVGEKIGGLIKEYVETGSVSLRETLLKEVPEAERKKLSAAALKQAATSSYRPPVSEILEIDREYREKAEAGKLKLIAPRLQNPGKKKWLPILSTESKGVKFTVMYSNTASAHELGKTHDWVVVYYKGPKGEGQCTVVTEQRGSRKGKRVIRGRENE